MTLITGATSGIGYAFACEFARQGHDVFLVSRNFERLEKVAKELGSRYAIKVHIAAIDLSRPDAWRELSGAVTTGQVEVENLINNVGTAISGDIATTDTSELLSLLDLNVRTTTALISCFVPGMISRGHGRILNVASMAGLLPLPHFAVYGSSKAQLIFLSKALNIELKSAGIQVTVIAPGFVKTGLLNKIKMGRGWFGDARFGLSAETVARAGYDGLFAGRVVVVPGIINMANAFALKILPERPFSKAVGWLLRPSSLRK